MRFVTTDPWKIDFVDLGNIDPVLKFFPSLKSFPHISLSLSLSRHRSLSSTAPSPSARTASITSLWRSGVYSIPLRGLLSFSPHTRTSLSASSPPAIKMLAIQVSERVNVCMNVFVRMIESACVCTLCVFETILYSDVDELRAKTMKTHAFSQNISII